MVKRSNSEMNNTYVYLNNYLLCADFFLIIADKQVDKPSFGKNNTFINNMNSSYHVSKGQTSYISIILLRSLAAVLCITIKIGVPFYST